MSALSHAGLHLTHCLVHHSKGASFDSPAYERDHLSKDLGEVVKLFKSTYWLPLKLGMEYLSPSKT